MNKNKLLADLVYIFHCIIIVFVLLAPFSNIPAILILHIIFSICLFVHWYANSNICSLTVLEANLRGLERSETFSHQFIGPIYDISNTEWSNFTWIITIFMMCVSIYKLYNTDKFKLALECYNRLRKDSTYTETLECFKPLFYI